MNFPNGSVTAIGDYAFYGYSGFTNIYSHIINPNNVLGVDVFGSVNKSDCQLNVPRVSLELYKEADQWKQFEHIVPFDEPGDVNGDEVVSGADVTVLYDLLLK